VHERAAQIVRRVGRRCLGGRLREAVHRLNDLLVVRAREDADVDRPGHPAVVALLDRAHSPRSNNTEQAGFEQLVHVVVDRALRPLHGPRHFGDGGGALEEEL
jgi:hypothetical protein